MTLCRNLVSSFLRDESGAAFVEFVIGAPLMLMVAFGVAEIGRAVTYHHAMDKSMRAATRYLARLPEAAIENWGLDNARNLAVYGNIDGVGQPLLPGWTTDSVNLPSGAAPPYETVILASTASYDFDLFSIVCAFGSADSCLTRLRFSVSHEERYVGN